MEKKNPTVKPSNEEPSNLELKVLPSHLKYFICTKYYLNDATDLLKNKVNLLIELLQKHKRAIWKTIVDIVGIHVGICTHNI